MVRGFRIAAVGAMAIVLFCSEMIFGAKAQGNKSFTSLDVADGDRLAHILCINCHVVDSNGPVVRTDRVPSFTWIAQQPGSTSESITVWLNTSHDRMPDFTLTRDEIRQLTAYILSLKKHRAIQ